MVPIIITASLVILVIIVFVIAYNALTAAENLVESSFGDIDVQLQRRQQLIPNLVALTKNYAVYESELLEKIAHQRTEGVSREQIAEDDDKLYREIRKIDVLAENYPELKASEPFHKLMKDLSGIEKDLMSARRFYNGTVRVYNTKLQSFPANIVGGFLNKKPAEFYIVSHDDQRQVTTVAL